MLENVTPKELDNKYTLCFIFRVAAVFVIL